MRDVHVDQIRDAVRQLCKDAATLLPDDVLQALKGARSAEEPELGVIILDQILENADLAARERLPLGQEPGTNVIFLEVGQDVHIAGGPLMDALAEGVGAGYTEGYLRASIVDKPFSSRVNTKNNTPPVVPKGGGCENMSRFTIMLPSAGKQGVSDFVLKAVEESGGNPCPPIIVGLGIGGTAEHAMYLAKRALTRKVGEPNPDPEEAAFETELLEKVNALGVGPQAVGGTTTALAVHMETYPTHIASLPVAVNLQCHSARLKEAVL